jgi:hypothetical protein
MADIAPMTSTKARQWADRARENGDLQKAAAWSRHADELAAQEAQSSWGKRADLA